MVDGDPGTTSVAVEDEDSGTTSVTVEDRDPGRAIILEGITYNRVFLIYPYEHLYSIGPIGRL
jgi:hypothetical protein